MDNQLLIYWLSGGGVKNLFWIKLCRAECRIVKLFMLGANTPIESESKNTEEHFVHPNLFYLFARVFFYENRKLLDLYKFLCTLEHERYIFL